MGGWTGEYTGRGGSTGGCVLDKINGFWLIQILLFGNVSLLSLDFDENSIQSVVGT